MCPAAPSPIADGRRSLRPTGWVLLTKQCSRAGMELLLDGTGTTRIVASGSSAPRPGTELSDASFALYLPARLPLVWRVETPRTVGACRTDRPTPLPSPV